MVSASMPGIISQTPIFYEGDKLVLELPKKYQALEGERLDGRFAALAKELGFKPEVRLCEAIPETAGA
jgi:exopolyphosphatase/guanosine-5'-triphosphate,3'-diphosphate pyrophosphatase